MTDLATDSFVFVQDDPHAGYRMFADGTPLRATVPAPLHEPLSERFHLDHKIPEPVQFDAEYGTDGNDW